MQNMRRRKNSKTEKINELETELVTVSVSLLHSYIIVFVIVIILQYCHANHKPTFLKTLKTSLNNDFK